MTLLEAIMSRDHCDEWEARELIDSMRLRLEEGEDPEDILYEEGFEPDYIPDLLDDDDLYYEESV